MRLPHFSPVYVYAIFQDSIDNVEAINRNPTVRREESIRNRGPRILWKFISRIDRPLTGGFANDAIPFYSRIRGARRLRQFAIGHGARECRPITDSISRAEADHHDHLHAWGHIRYGKAFFPYSIARIEKGPARSIVSARSHDGHGSAGLFNLGTGWVIPALFTVKIHR